MNPLNYNPFNYSIIADHDDRVVPLHSYKYIAQLQHQLGDRFPNTPLMIHVDTGTGHGGAKPTDKIVNNNYYIPLILFIKFYICSIRLKKRWTFTVLSSILCH